jgi:hypothetical protein
MRAATLWFERAAKHGNALSTQVLRRLSVQGVLEASAALRRLGL